MTELSTMTELTDAELDVVGAGSLVNVDIALTNVEVRLTDVIDINNNNVDVGVQAAIGVLSNIRQRLTQ